MRTRYVNLQAFTGLAEKPLLTEFVVEDGLFADPGDHLPGEKTVDLGGAFVSPAFIEAHAHPMMIAEALETTACVPPNVNSIEEMIEALSCSEAAREGEGWIEGWGYDEMLLAEGRAPTRRDLDRVSAARPVVVRRSDCHSCAVNSAALRLAGITRETPDPAGAVIGRDADGEPNGLLIETAASALIERVRPPLDEARRMARMLRLREHYLSHGILTTTEMMPRRLPGSPDDALAVWRRAVAAGVPVDVNLYFAWTGGDDPFGVPELTPEEKTGPVRYAGVKLFGDGSVSGRTAAMREPFRFPEGAAPAEPAGFMTLSAPVFRAALAYARRNGVALSVHIMGDRSIDTVLDWLEGEAPWLPDAPSVRLEHVTMMRADQLARMQGTALKPALTTQVIFPFAEWRSYRAALTAENLDAVCAVDEMARAADAFALSSDAPATTWADADQVLTSVMAAVTRRDAVGGFFGKRHAVSPAVALSLYTGRAARVMPTSGKVGVIAPGARAHFVTLTGNPLSCAPEAIDDIRVSGTWRDGLKLWPKA